MDAEQEPPASCDVVRVPVEEILDLHSFAPRDIASVIDEYLDAARAAGFGLVRLIHGRGKGVQRAFIQRHLRANPGVAEFWDAPNAHLGATIVKLHMAPIAPQEASSDDRSPS